MILTFNIKVSSSSFNWIQAIRISNYLNSYIWDKHLVINIHHKTYFRLLLGHYYHMELNALLLRTMLPLKQERPLSHTQSPTAMAGSHSRAGLPPVGPGWSRAETLASPHTCSAEKDTHLHAGTALITSSSNSVYHLSYTRQGFSYGLEEFCVYLVKAYLEVKSIMFLRYLRYRQEVFCSLTSKLRDF